MKDKSLLKVGGLIAIVIGALYCLTIVGIIVGIPLIMGGIKFRDLSNYSDEEIVKQKETLLIWSIVFLVLSLIPGVLGLIFYVGLDQDERVKAAKASDTTSKYRDLEEIKKLYDDKVLTKAEYEAQKKKILGE